MLEYTPDVLPFDLCQEHEIEISAISLYQDYSPDHQLLTIRVHGEDLEGFINALWKSGGQVNRISNQSELS